MLLLVVGLVVIVLVILVVVFLSVRSMRADEGDDYPVRPARTGRAGNGRDDYGDAGAARRGEIRRQPVRRRQADESQPGRETGYGEPDYGQTRTRPAQDYDDPRGYRGHDLDSGQDLDASEPDLDPRRLAAASARPAGGAAPQRRFGGLPRPRGHQHDEESGLDAGPDARDDSRRAQRQESRLRPPGNGRDRSGPDWPASDWGGVSDEQYWAELAADKPLATTARSAQPAIDPRQGAAAGDLTGRKGRRDAASGRPRQEASPTMAAAPTTQFSLRSESEPAASAEPWAAVSTARGSDTDPSVGTSGWPDTAAGDSPAASWAAPGAAWAPDTSWTAPDTGARAPDAPDTSWAAPDTGARAPDAPGTEDTRTWDGEDPLTSPSFSAPRTYSDRVPDSAGYGSAGYGSGDDHLASRGWPGDPGARPDGDSYGSPASGWSGSEHEYPSGALEPLPGLSASAAEPAGSWYSAPTPEADAQPYAEPSYPAWQQDEARHGNGAGHGYGTGPDQRDWQAAGPEYGAGTGYELPGYGADHAAYGQDSHPPGSDGGGYPQAGHSAGVGTGYDDPGPGWSGAGPGHSAGVGTGYDDPGPGWSGAGPGDSAGVGTGYDDPGPGWSGAGQQLPGHGPGDAGYPQPGYGWAEGGHPGEAGYDQPGHAWDGTTGYGLGDSRYPTPGHSDGRGGGDGDQGPGHGHYSGYDGGRR
jgi:hypothetical protein